MNRRALLGRTGEDLAAAFVTDLGWRLLDRNWRCREGEIDLIAQDGREIVVIEVKTRRDTRFGTPLEAVTFTKLARLRMLAHRWRAETGARGPLRIDVLGILIDRTGASTIDHVRSVG